jgi:hypothetical protein
MFRRRQCWVPTWKGWLVVLLSGALAAVISLRTVHGFLAVSAPLDSSILVVEGWMPDSGAAQVVAEFKRQGYAFVCVTGGPLERGEPLSEYKTYADLGAAILIKLGLSADSIKAVPAPQVRKDRTYASAVALKEWLKDHGGIPPKLNVVSVGPHARRTRLMFAKAFGNHTLIGIIALEDPNYDPRRWWRSSIGVRSVIDEVVAYFYARFLFRSETG